MFYCTLRQVFNIESQNFQKSTFELDLLFTSKRKKHELLNSKNEFNHLPIARISVVRKEKPKFQKQKTSQYLQRHSSAHAQLYSNSIDSFGLAWVVGTIENKCEAPRGWKATVPEAVWFVRAWLPAPLAHVG